MLEYNTQKEKLVLPEYGRNVQEMVNYCMTIEDRDERNKCAASIVDIMSNLFSSQSHVEDFNKMLWNQLAIISDFKLDIDYPCEVIRPENLHSKPVPVYYKLMPIRYRHYGKIIERLVSVAVEMPDDDARLHMSLLIAEHMKKLLIQANIDGIDDDKVFKDLAYFSKGRIILNSAEYKLHDYKSNVGNIQTQQSGKKSKKRR